MPDRRTGSAFRSERSRSWRDTLRIHLRFFAREDRSMRKKYANVIWAAGRERGNRRRYRLPSMGSTTASRSWDSNAPRSIPGRKASSPM